jgi:hypothetical protein
MALKADRIHGASHIDFFMNETAERGGIVCVSTGGSGAAMDQSLQLCTYAANPSGKYPLGVLMNDMVNLDLTRQHENWNKDEIQQGGKVTIWNQGTVLTNRVYPGHTPTAGMVAYLAHSGLVGTSSPATADATYPENSRTVGRWLSSKDEDGYAKLAVNCPVTGP